MTRSEREMHGDREMEEGIKSARGGGVKWKRRRGTMELYKSKRVHLITGLLTETGMEECGRGRGCGGEEV